MKRLALYTGVMVFAIAGALAAQEPNTTAPGPTTNPQPNTANSDLANPGNPQDQAHPGMAMAQSTGTTTSQSTGTTTDTTNTTGQTTNTNGVGTQGNGVTGGTVDTQNQPTTDTTGMTGKSVRTTGTTGTTADTTGTTGTTTDTTGTTGSTDTTSTTNGSAASSSSTNLPRTASDMPLVGLVGLLSLASGLALRSRS